MSGSNRKSAGLLRGALAAAFLLCAPAGVAFSQQPYQNFEITPDGRGGAHGTYGGQNFEFDRSYSQPPSGHLGGRNLNEAPSSGSSRPGATRKNCLVDGQGRVHCN
ncbi:hypothetical protein NOF55_13570 [Rhizobiaceae bacterium BDR2-2]|uniref:Uncharacterized protein n=1 Tax=Ectorhizobium quercum TaxID=2965071 RepID=A0AAE3SVA9_9HYPH|nr:hypothetical protein [Ectorhizobium quercum]MCX8998135.1 hypothetical protein [Ectorhizobium quercum]